MKYSYEELISEIEKRREKVILEIELKEDNDKIDFLKYFFDHYNLEKITTLADIFPSELITIYLLEENRELDYDVVSEEIKEIDEFIDTIGLDFLEVLIDNLEELDTDKLEELISKEHNLSLIEKIKFIKQVNDLFENIGIANIGFNTTSNIFKILKTARTLKKIKNEKYLTFLMFVKHFNNELDKIKALNPEVQEKRLNTILNRIVDKAKVNETYKPLYEYYQEVENKIKKEARERSKKLYGYEKILDIVRQEKDKKEIVNIDQYLDKVYEKDLEVLILKYIYTHNKQYYDKLEAEYAYKSENSMNKYISYFNEISISFKEQNEELQQKIMKDSLDVVKEKVALLQKLNLEEKELLDILANTSLETIKELDELLRNNYISKEFILNDLTIYYNEEKLTKVTTNIEHLLKERINLRAIEDKSFLLTNNDILIRNIELLKLVGINLKTIKVKSLEMLSDETLINKIASLIELGLEKLLIYEPEILNLDNNLIKRIVIAKTIGMEIVQDNRLNETIANKNDFFVADSMLDLYLLDRDNSNYKTTGTIIFDKEEQKNDKQYYNIEGIRIPKLRVNNLQISLENIIKPSFYTQEEVKVLERHKSI